MKIIIIKYNGNPNTELEVSQCSNYEYCTLPMSRELTVDSRTSAIEALEFLASCTNPITKFSNIAWAFKNYPDLCDMMNEIGDTVALVTKASVRTEKRRYYAK